MISETKRQRSWDVLSIHESPRIQGIWEKKMQSSDVYKILPYVEFGKMSETQRPSSRHTVNMQFGHQNVE